MQKNLKNGKINNFLNLPFLYNFRNPNQYFHNHLASIQKLITKEKQISTAQIHEQILKEGFCFQFKNINNPTYFKQKLQIDHENHKTENFQWKVEKKGFQYCQYQANNLIEDTMVSFEILELNAFVVSIFDGHGGQELANFCAQNIAKMMKKFIKIHMKIPKYKNNQIQLIKQALKRVHSELENRFYEIYCQKIKKDKKKFKGVGTCAITLVLLQGQFIVATCGDSQAIIIEDNFGSYNFKKLSERYSVNNKLQRQRLLKQFQSTDENIIIEERKNVFYLKGILQPTKSIGDYYLKVQEHFFGQGQFNGPYLSCEPDIQVFNIQAHDKYIVMASDGLWDQLSKWEVLKHVVEKNKQKKTISERQTECENDEQSQFQSQVNLATFLCEKILQKVSQQIDSDVSFLKKLQSGSRRYYHDDISICVIDLEQFFSLQQKNI